MTCIDRNVWDHYHCPEFHKFDSQTFKPKLIHVMTFITSLPDLGRLPLVCFLKFCTDDPRIATRNFVHWGWHAGQSPPPFKCGQLAQWTFRFQIVI